MRKYTRLDLIRFHRFAQERPELKPVELVSAYNEAHPEKSQQEKNANFAAALALNNLYKALTGTDIPGELKYFDEPDEPENP